jgi:hypothetical protein
MADSKISDLTAAGANDGTEIVPVVQGGSTKRTTTQFISDLGSSSGLTGTYTFGGGGSGDIASMTFNNGYLTAVTLVP